MDRARRPVLPGNAAVLAVSKLPLARAAAAAAAGVGAAGASPWSGACRAPLGPGGAPGGAGAPARARPPPLAPSPRANCSGAPREEETSPSPRPPAEGLLVEVEVTGSRCSSKDDAASSRSDSVMEVTIIQSPGRMPGGPPARQGPGSPPCLDRRPSRDPALRLLSAPSASSSSSSNCSAPAPPAQQPARPGPVHDTLARRVKKRALRRQLLRLQKRLLELVDESESEAPESEAVSYRAPLAGTSPLAPLAPTQSPYPSPSPMSLPWAAPVRLRPEAPFSPSPTPTPAQPSARPDGATPPPAQAVSSEAAPMRWRHRRAPPARAASSSTTSLSDSALARHRAPAPAHPPPPHPPSAGATDYLNTGGEGTQPALRADSPPSLLCASQSDQFGQLWDAVCDLERRIRQMESPCSAGSLASQATLIDELANLQQLKMQTPREPTSTEALITALAADAFGKAACARDPPAQPPAPVPAALHPQGQPPLHDGLTNGSTSCERGREHTSPQHVPPPPRAALLFAPSQPARPASAAPAPGGPPRAFEAPRPPTAPAAPAGALHSSAAPPSHVCAHAPAFDARRPATASASTREASCQSIDTRAFPAAFPSPTVDQRQYDSSPKRALLPHYQLASSLTFSNDSKATPPAAARPWTIPASLLATSARGCIPDLTHAEASTRVSPGQPSFPLVSKPPAPKFSLAPTLTQVFRSTATYPMMCAPPAAQRCTGVASFASGAAVDGSSASAGGAPASSARLEPVVAPPSILDSSTFTLVPASEYEISSSLFRADCDPDSGVAFVPQRRASTPDGAPAPVAGAVSQFERFLWDTNFSSDEQRTAGVLDDGQALSSAARSLAPQNLHCLAAGAQGPPPSPSPSPLQAPPPAPSARTPRPPSPPQRPPPAAPPPPSPAPPLSPPLLPCPAKAQLRHSPPPGRPVATRKIKPSKKTVAPAEGQTSTSPVAKSPRPPSAPSVTLTGTRERAASERGAPPSASAGGCPPEGPPARPTPRRSAAAAAAAAAAVRRPGAKQRSPGKRAGAGEARELPAAHSDPRRADAAGAEGSGAGPEAAPTGRELRALVEQVVRRCLAGGGSSDLAQAVEAELRARLGPRLKVTKTNDSVKYLVKGLRHEASSHDLSKKRDSSEKVGVKCAGEPNSKADSGASDDGRSPSARAPPPSARRPAAQPRPPATRDAGEEEARSGAGRTRDVQVEFEISNSDLERMVRGRQRERAETSSCPGGGRHEGGGRRQRKPSPRPHEAPAARLRPPPDHESLCRT